VQAPRPVRLISHQWLVAVYSFRVNHHDTMSYEQQYASSCYRLEEQMFAPADEPQKLLYVEFGDGTEDSYDPNDPADMERFNEAALQMIEQDLNFTAKLVEA